MCDGKNGCYEPDCSITGDSIFSCHCSLGYENEGLVCVDINECASNLHTCNTTTSVCNNTFGGYECLCLPGYNYTNINECSGIYKFISIFEINLFFNFFAFSAMGCGVGFVSQNGECVGKESIKCER